MTEKFGRNLAITIGIGGLAGLTLGVCVDPTMGISNDPVAQRLLEHLTSEYGPSSGRLAFYGANVFGGTMGGAMVYNIARCLATW